MTKNRIGSIKYFCKTKNLDELEHSEQLRFLQIQIERTTLIFQDNFLYIADKRRDKNEREKSKVKRNNLKS